MTNKTYDQNNNIRRNKQINSSITKLGDSVATCFNGV